jgi:hypothetical protein
VTGGGNTPEEATENLRQNFESTRRRRLLEDKPPVRPGIKVPIEFASQVKVGENGELSEDFIQRVLGLDWAWISDESSLWDFHTDENNELLYSKILDVYDVDVSDIESAKLYEIFERIKHAQKAGL